MGRSSSVVRQIVDIPVNGVWSWPAMRAWLSARAIEGIEVVGPDDYWRTTEVGAVPAIVHVTPGLERVRVQVTAQGLIAVEAIAACVARLLDLDRDLAAMRARLGEDPWLGPLLVKHDGLRVPGGWQSFELAVRAVLGQQVAISAARQLASHLVVLCGRPLPEALRTPGLDRLFPSASRLAAADLGALRMPGARRSTLVALACAVAADERVLAPGAPLDEAIARLRAIRGIGEWTAHYIALRALRHPDAFPASDVGLLRGAARAMGARPTPATLLRRAEAWRPSRAYAAQLLWAEDAGS